MMAHAFSPRTQGAEVRDLCGFEASLGYRTSSRTAKVTERNPALKNKQNETKKEVCSRLHSHELLKKEISLRVINFIKSYIDIFIY